MKGWRTLASCMAEVRREFPYLSRAQRREVARHLQLISRLEVLRQEVGVEKVRALLRKAVQLTREEIERQSRSEKEK